MVLRFCLGMMLAFLSASLVQAQQTADRIRFGFFPPADTDIVYRVDQRHAQSFGTTDRVADWSHEVHFRLGAKLDGDIHVGTFSIRAVTAREGAQADAGHLMAKAVEGQSFTIKIQHGVPIEVDWPAMKSRLESQLPKITDPPMAQMMIQTFPAFEPDGVNAVLRPFWATGIGYLRSFNRDGSVAEYANMDLPSWFQVPGSTLTTYGGKEEGTDDLLLIWRLAPAAKAAAGKLGPELRQLASTVASPADRTRVEAMLDKLLAGDIEVVEGGAATFDSTPGLMRRFQLDTRLVAGELRRETRIVITRLAPD